VQIIPAIDLKDGKCVRLYKGEESNVTVFSEKPGDVAKKWEDAGAGLIHVVDLDGAFSGEPVNVSAIEDILSSVACPTARRRYKEHRDCERIYRSGYKKDNYRDSRFQ